MAGSIYGLYPVARYDRRQQSIPVEVERRSGVDRRQSNSIFPTSVDKRAYRPALDPRLNRQINDIKAYYTASNNQNTPDNGVKEGLLDSIPYYRRAEGVYNSVKDHDAFKAGMGAGLFAINLPADTADIKTATKQVMGKAAKEVPHCYQTKFSFFRGTLLEPMLKKFIKSENPFLKKAGNKIYNADITLYDTEIGRKTLDKLGREKSSIIKTTKLDAKGKAVRAIKNEGKPLARLFGRAMLRVPVIGIALMGLMELPSIARAFTAKDGLKDNAANGMKQIVKSGVNIVSFVAASAICGAALACLGPVGSLVGIGLGSYIGTKVADRINKKIDGISLSPII